MKKSNEKIRAALFDRHVKYNQTELVMKIIEGEPNYFEDTTNLFERKYASGQVFVKERDLRHNGISYEGSITIVGVDNDQDLKDLFVIDGSNEKIASSALRQIEKFCRMEEVKEEELSDSDICDILFVEGLVIDDEESMDYEEREKVPNQWWLIDETMASWMKELGVLVYEYLGCFWWGRIGGNSCASDDFDINLVARHIGILNGQENSWGE